MNEDRSPFPTSDLVGFGDITYMNEDREATMRAALVEATEQLEYLAEHGLVVRSVALTLRASAKKCRAALNAGGEGDGAPVKNPSYVYDPDNWDCTYEWGDRDLVHGEGDALDPGGVMKVNTLYIGPPKFVANVAVTRDEAGDPDEMAIRWFNSEEEAKAALASPPTNAHGTGD